MAQCSYMQEVMPFDYLPERAAKVQPHLRRLLETVLAFVEAEASRIDEWLPRRWM